MHQIIMLYTFNLVLYISYSSVKLGGKILKDDNVAWKEIIYFLNFN